MIEQPMALCQVVVRRFPIVTAVILSLVVCACSVYANLSFAVTNRATYRYFPPFIRGVNANDNRHLGAEYWNIARAMRRGEGFAHPFTGRTGPTAWMPPVLPTLLAGLHWACEGEADAVMAVFIFLQTAVLVGTGLLVLDLSRRTTRLWAVVPATIFLALLLSDFHSWFQFTHDCWIVLLAIDLLLAGVCLGRPLGRWPAAAAWGLFGGWCTLVSPIVGFAWGGLSLLAGVRERAWSSFAVAVLAAAVTLTPWTVRNYLVFGRLIPVKSNAAYELYQSQCLQPDGLLQGRTFGSHPYAAAGRERHEYQTMGESAFLDRKSEQFWRAVWADPADFLDRVASRFLGSTLWYVPFDRNHETRRPWTTLACRVLHPLPFLGLLVLVFTAVWKRLDWSVWFGAALYLLYLTPYIAVSYYERYAVPLLGVKVLLAVWAIDVFLTFLMGIVRPAAPAEGRSSAPVAAGRRGKAVPASS